MAELPTKKNAGKDNLEKVSAITELYKSKTQLLNEILKMYFRLLLVFAIAIFACVEAVSNLGAVQCKDAQDMLFYMYLIGPYFILSWFAGYLFLYWNYEVVIDEMDGIAAEIENSVKLKGTGILGHNAHLNRYAEISFLFIPFIKSIYVLYIIIGLPAIFAYIYFGTLGFDKCPDIYKIPYLLGLIVGPIFCMLVHFRFVRKGRAK